MPQSFRNLIKIQKTKSKPQNVSKMTKLLYSHDTKSINAVSFVDKDKIIKYQITIPIKYIYGTKEEIVTILENIIKAIKKN